MEMEQPVHREERGQQSTLWDSIYVKITLGLILLTDIVVFTMVTFADTPTNACGGLWWYCMLLHQCVVLNPHVVSIDLKHMRQLWIYFVIWGLLIMTDLLHRSTTWDEGRQGTCSDYWEEKSLVTLVYFKVLVWLSAFVVTTAALWQ